MVDGNGPARRISTSSVGLVVSHWKHGVYTLAGNTFVYVGKAVRRDDQLPPGFEPAHDPDYKEVGDGHVKV